ncbi:MAG TPA: hypothetical protein VFP84_03630 [Kofleriaceae bacterium]|nr:hypothetical protein [Kofleriaceae bacterium]
MIARAGAALVLAAAGIAHAEPAPAPTPAQAALDAGDANLAPIADRSGLVFTGALGGGLMVGFGINDSVGRGGSVSFRLGHVATPRTVIDFELDVTAALHKQAENAATATNTETSLLAGAQYYAHRSLWLRFAGGLGVYQGRDVVLDNGQRGDQTLVGPAVLAGIGVEIARFKWAVFGIEASVSAMFNRDGVLVANGLDVNLAFD